MSTSLLSGSCQGSRLGAVGKGEVKRSVSRRLSRGIELCISDGKDPVVVGKDDIAEANGRAISTSHSRR